MILSLRVVSYNVLSSHLASPSHFTTLLPEHLDARNRLPIVLDKLQQEIKWSKENEASAPCVFCLQEVSYDWAGAFHTFFSNQGYHMVTGLYGKKFNGYMGVAMAWPTDTLETVSVDISRLSDTRPDGWPAWPDDRNAGALQQIWKGVVPLVTSPLRLLGLINSSEGEPDHWGISRNRFNVLLTATLRDKKSGKSYCIGNYHMPCAFYAPMVMTIHSEMAARRVQELARDLPYILTGDFNIKPIDSMYKLLTTGLIEETDPAYPTPKNGFKWTSNIKPMRSAYASSLGQEPDFTNYARVGENEPFIDTLDYIFLSPEWDVTSVKNLPNRDEAGGPFPNLDEGEPSDHILIATSLELLE